MTVIAGLEHRGKVWIGGDSAGTNRLMHQQIRADKKVFVRGDFIFGFTGSFRMGQLLNHSLEIPVRPKGKKPMKFLVQDFTQAVRECLGKEGLEPRFLFGYQGKLYEIQGDYQIAKSNQGYGAVGSGRDLALGALHASRQKNPKKKILEALEAAAAGNAAVRGPFTILKK